MKVLIFPLYFTSIPYEELKSLQIVSVIVLYLEHLDRPAIRGNNKFFTFNSTFYQK